LTNQDLLKTLKKDDTLYISLSGRWTALSAEPILHTLSQIELSGVQKVCLSLQDLVKLDTTGAYILSKFINGFKEFGILVHKQDISPTALSLLKQVSDFAYEPKRDSFSPSYRRWIEGVGEKCFAGYRKSLHFIEFIGEVCLGTFRMIRHPHQFRYLSFFGFVERVGVHALPIIGLISFLIGVVLAYQGVGQLAKFGAEIFTVNLVGVSVLREVGILLTAIVVAGRSGSAFAAQIGSMKLNEEVDAIQTFGLSPVDVLVIPRITALLVALPLLAVYSGVLGILGGAVMIMNLVDISFQTFLSQLKAAVSLSTFWVGFIKAPVFAVIIGLVGCFEGLNVKGGAESVGEKTTLAVVESIFLVLVLDAAFSILFSYLGV